MAYTPRKPEIGSVSHGTMRQCDLIPVFADLLRDITPSPSPKCVLDADALADYDSEEATWVLEELFDALNDEAPAGCYFGAHPGDGSDYGFWECEEDV